MSASLCLGVSEGMDLQGAVGEQKESPKGDRGGRLWSIFLTPTCAFTGGQQEALGRLYRQQIQGLSLRPDSQGKPEQPGTKSGMLASKYPVLDHPPSQPESRCQPPSLRPRCRDSCLLPQIQDSSISPPPSDPGNRGNLGPAYLCSPVPVSTRQLPGDSCLLSHLQQS